MNKSLFYLFVILIPLIVMLSSARMVVFDKTLHEKLFLQNKVGFDNSKELNNEVISYLKGNTPSIQTTFFTDKEKDHLKDVRTLINFLSSVLYFSIIIFVLLLIFFYQKDKVLIRNVFFYGGILTFVMLIIGVLMFLINFDFAFSLFHKIFFPQGNYIFRTNLPLLYNSGWYFWISLRIVVYCSIFAFILIVQNFVLKKKVSQ